MQASGTAALAGLQQVTSSTDQPVSDQPEKENCSTTGGGGDQQAAPPNKRQKREPKDPKPAKQAKAQPEGPAAAAAQSPPDLRPPPEPTEYAKNRPRRETGRGGMALGHTTESLELVKCCDFVGPPGSGAPLAQPFQVEVDAQVSDVRAPPGFVRFAKPDKHAASSALHLRREMLLCCTDWFFRVKALSVLLHSVTESETDPAADLNVL